MTLNNNNDDTIRVDEAWEGFSRRNTQKKDPNRPLSKVNRKEEINP